MTQNEMNIYFSFYEFRVKCRKIVMTAIAVAVRKNQRRKQRKNRVLKVETNFCKQISANDIEYCVLQIASGDYKNYKKLQSVII